MRFTQLGIAVEGAEAEEQYLEHLFRENQFKRVVRLIQSMHNENLKLRTVIMDLRIELMNCKG